MSILIRNSKAIASGIIEKEGFDSVEPMPFGGATSLVYRVCIEGKEYRTVAIAAEAFGGRRIKSVYIPEGVKEIGMNAFCQCDRLLSLQLPNSVEKIEVSCFEEAKSLQDLKFSNNIKEIPQKAFVKCGSLEKLTIPKE